MLSCFSRVQLSAKPWTVARQSPLSMGFSRQEYWSGRPFLLQGIFPTQGPKFHLLHFRQFPALQVDSLRPEPPGKPVRCAQASVKEREIQTQGDFAYRADTGGWALCVHSQNREPGPLANSPENTSVSPRDILCLLHP